MQLDERFESRSVLSSEQTNKVLKNTYALLGMTLVFSALTAVIGMQMRISMNPIIFLIGAYGLMFLTSYLAKSAWGLVSVFAFTGFMGLSLAPMLNFYLGQGMGDVVVSALGMTAFAFIGLSIVAVTTKKDLSFLSKFLFIGFFVLIAGMIASIFISGLHLVISAGFVVFASVAILFTTNQIVRGGETNYIMATVSLYVSIYNLFVSLLSLLGSSRD